MPDSAPDLDAIVAANVRALRAFRDWKQSELAAKVGWSDRTISKLESGQRGISIGDCVRFCEAFEVPLARLLDGASEKDLRILGF